MAARTDGDRLDRLEQVVQILAEDQISLQKIVADLATETRRGFDRVAAQFAETDRRIKELSEATDRRFQETGRRMQESDQRMRENDQRMREHDRRMREIDQRMREAEEQDRQRAKALDERIDKLVVAIGEFIRRQPPQQL